MNMGLCKILGNLNKFYFVLVKEVYILTEQKVNEYQFSFPILWVSYILVETSLSVKYLTYIMFAVNAPGREIQLPKNTFAEQV